MKHLLTLLVENKPSVLARVANQMGRRGVNIDYFTARNLIDGDLTVITIGFEADEHGAERIAMAMDRLVNVLEVTCWPEEYPLYSSVEDARNGIRVPHGPKTPPVDRL